MFFKKTDTKIPWRMYLVISMVVLGVVLFLYQRFYYKKITVAVNNNTMRLLVADTLAKEYKGLSDRNNLGEYDGMIFLFATEAKQTMVMRDMRFPIDMVWVNRGVVVDVAPEVPLELGKTEAELTRYTPRLNANTVIELKSGLAKKLGIQVGSVIAEVK